MLKHFLLVTFTLFLSLLLSSKTFAAIESQRIALNRGLEDDRISALLFDHQGFMWIGSKNGLFVYDGYQIQKHTPHSDNPNAISALDIRNIYQGSDNSIWVSTNSGGLNKYEPKTNSFIQFRHDSSVANSISNDSVYDVVEGPDGHLWIATQIGLNRLNQESGKVSHFYFDENNANSLPNNYVYKLFLDSQKRLWLGTIGGGLAYWQPDKQDFVRITLPTKKHNDVFDIVEDKNKNIWLGTRGGLLKVNAKSNNVELVDIVPTTKKQPLIIDLHFTNDNKLAIATSGYGLLFFDSQNHKPLTDHIIPKSLSKGTITSIIENNQNTLFVGTWGAGIYRVSPPVANIALVAKANVESHQPIYNVSALYSDQINNKTWIGTLGTGLHWLDQQTGKIVKVNSPLAWSKIEGIYSITQLANQQVFVGTSKGLWHLSSIGETIAFYEHNPTQANSIGKGYVRVLEPTVAGNLWVGVGGSGLHFFNLDSKKFTVHRHDNAKSNSISGDYITSILVDDKDVWVGTRSNGLNRCQIAKWHCQRFKPNSRQNGTLNHFHITDIARDNNGGIWIGTDGGGLSKILFDQKNKVASFENVSKNIGIVGESIRSITPEQDGNLWVTTNKGVTLFNPFENSAFSLVEEQLFNIGSFSQNASSQSATTNYFGAFKGLISVERDQVYSPQVPAQIRFTNIEHDLLSSPLTNMAIASDIELSIAWGTALTLEFSLLDFSEKKHEYEYRLAPNEAWKTLHNREYMTFFQMEPGYYQIAVRGKGIHGRWSLPAQVNVEIVPPWWMNKTVRVLGAIAIIIMFTFFHRMRISRWKENSARLQALQQQKQIALDEVQNRERKLNTAYQGLRSLAKQLQNAKEDERKSISRELHDEFGQTLTATKINLQLFNKFSDKADKRIIDAISTIQTMIQQVRAISFDLRPTLLDDVGLVAGVEHQLQKMSALLDNPILFMVTDGFPTLNQQTTTTLFRVIQESVNNALKYAHAEQVSVSLSYDSENILVEIKDNGKGFDVKRVKENTFRGVHLGLLGIEERVHSLDGKLSLSSVINKGSTIKVEIAYV